jgi:hypothetical protein
LFVVLLLTVFLTGTRAYGQGGATGAISGVVADTSGGSVAGADVQIIDTRTEAIARKLTTNADGSFVATLLPPGTYYVVVNKTGFSEAKATGIEVHITETTRVTIALKPGTVTEKVEISAQVTSVETTNATTGQSLGTETVRELPLATQNYQQLLTLSTGAQSELNAAAQLGRGSVKLFVNGQREDNNNFLIEGISATDYNVAQASYVPLPNPDVIQEFKVQTSLYDASQGRNGGGNVNAILKSGTKEFHGDAYEYFRNDVLNANEFFLNRDGLARPSVKQNIFGGSLGGPVGKEKWGYFFVNYQGTRQRSGLSPGTFISTTIPVLPADRSEASLISTFFPTGLPEDITGLDPVSAKLLQFKSNQFGGTSNGFLIPSGDPTTRAFAVSHPGKFTDDQFTSNWDREFRGGQDKVSARFFFSNSESLLPFGAGDLQESLGSTLSSSISSTALNFPFDTPVHARFFNATETHLFSSTLVNEFRFGFVHINYSLNNIPPVTDTDLGIDHPTHSVTNSIYKFVFASSGFEIGPAPFGDQHQTQNNLNFVDTVSWVKGAHVFRFGGEFTRVNLDKLFPQVFNGELFFTNTTDGNSDFQNFLLGTPQFSFGGGGVFNHEYRANNYGFFAQDDWKIRPDLTLNLGIRTEIFGGFHDDLCHIGNLDPSLAAKGEFPFVYPSCVNGLSLTGLSGSASSTTYNNNYSIGLGPRIGLAYDLFGHHTTTIRAGFGIYYVREDVGSVDQLSFQAPFLPVAFGGSLPGCMGSLYSTNAPASCIPVGLTSNPNGLPLAGTLDPAFVPCLSVFQGFVVNGSNPPIPTNDTTQTAVYGSATGSACPGPLLSTNIFGLQVPRHFVVPSTQQWNLTVQRSLGRQWVLEVGYIGTHAVHLRETRDNLQSQRASVANPVKIDSPFCTPSPCVITTNTFGNAVARSLVQGINGYNGFQLFANDAYSHYHSMQATLSRRWGAGYFQAAYTFSKSTDATSTGNTAFNTAFNDESTLDASRGLSDFDRPHRFVVSYRYDLPFFKDATGATAALLKGWSVSGITIFQSGSPFSVTDSGAGTGFLGAGFTPGTLTGSLASGSTLASALSSGDIHSRLDGYLNVNALTAAPQLYPLQCDPINNPAQFDPNFCTTDFGNLGRNTFRGPHQQNWDFSLIKNFKLTERQSLRFTTDFFNIWNHANFGNPTINDVESIPHDPITGQPLTTGPFGKITSTVGTPRLIQLSLRYAF